LVPFCVGGAFGSFRTPDEDGGVNVEVFCGSLGGSSALVEGGALGSTLDGLEDAILAGTSGGDGCSDFAGDETFMPFRLGKAGAGGDFELNCPDLIGL